MNRLISALAALSACFLLAQPAVALTSVQRDVHFAQILSNLGTVAEACDYTPKAGYGMMCATYHGSTNLLTEYWDLYADSATKVTITAKHLSPWRNEDGALLTTFATADGDVYMVGVTKIGNGTLMAATWLRTPSDGNLARLSKLATASTPVDTVPSSSSTATTASSNVVAGTDILPLPGVRVRAFPRGSIRYGLDVRWSSDRSILYTLGVPVDKSKNLILRSWNAESLTIRRERRITLARESSSEQFEVSSDGKLLYLIADYEHLWVLDAITFETIATFALPSSGVVQELAVHPKRPEVAVITGNQLYVVDLLRGTVRMGPDGLSSASYNPLGTILAVGSESRSGARLAPTQFLDSTTLGVGFPRKSGLNATRVAPSQNQE